MSVIQNNLLLAGDDAYNLQRSLRFRSSASAYIARTPSSAGNRQIWTYSVWAKLGGAVGTSNYNILMARTGGSYYTGVYFNANNLYFDWFNGSQIALLRTNQVFRDPSAWYHIVIQVDTTQATASNRIRMYVNGSLITSLQNNTYPSQNAQTAGINEASVAHWISSDPAFSAQGYYDGYLTEIHFVDGQALTPSSFGMNDPQTGVWEPIRYTGTYGTNGFYLPFSDTSSLSNLTADRSGRGNNWTANNISLTAGATYDSMTDVPTLTSATQANFAVMNPVSRFVGGSVTNGNLTVSTTAPGNDLGVDSSFCFPTSGKFYWEVTMSYSNDGSADRRTPLFITDAPPNTTALGNYIYTTGQTAAINSNVGTVNSGLGSATTNGQTICFAYDIDNARVWMSKQANIDIGTTATVTNFPNTSGLMRFQIREFSGTISGTAQVNFGQRPFAYTPPTGFVALNTFNLPTPTIGATASTRANRFFDAKTYTGTSATQTITVDFASDFAWLKRRDGIGENVLLDRLRLTGSLPNRLFSNSTNAESTIADGQNSFSSTGIVLDGTGGGGDVNTSPRSYVAWQWRANGTGVTNTAGSITSTVSANTTSGFSIVTYTGTGSLATVGHGLGVAPAVVIVKNRTTAGEWWHMYHRSLGPTQAVFFNNTNAAGTNVNWWNNTAPTSNVFTVNTSGAVNGSSQAIVAYCFAEVAGFSRFGSYTGNGSADGPFVFCGFRPRYIMFKRTNTTGDWVINDSARNPNNAMSTWLYANLVDADTTFTFCDFLSNGFKIRVGPTAMNNNGDSYIFMAFAENPFKYSLAR